MPLQEVKFDEKDLKKLFRPNTRMSRFLKYFKRFLVSALTYIIVVIILFYGMNLPAFLKRLEYQTQAVDVKPEPKPVITTPLVNYAPEIQIAKINLTAPAHYGIAYDALIEKLKDGVVHYEGSALPGQQGNVVLMGHSSDYPWSSGSYKTVFALLDQLVIGDEIVLPYQTTRYVYTVTDKMIVKPTTLSVLNKTATPSLTLVTCYPVGTAINRLVIRAQLTSGPVSGEQLTEPFLGSTLPTPR